jgi:hypothetical protein
LSDAGIQTLGFADPVAALDAIETGTRLRLLVTRVNFGRGKLNGVALARMLLVKRPGSKVLFLALPSNQEHTEGLGEFMPVPLVPDALVEAVGRLLAASD